MITDMHWKSHNNSVSTLDAVFDDDVHLWVQVRRWPNNDHLELSYAAMKHGDFVNASEVRKTVTLYYNRLMLESEEQAPGTYMLANCVFTGSYLRDTAETVRSVGQRLAEEDVVASAGAPPALR